ncbi:conserved hypothetical protein [Anaeromyxobacter dehalogenans 2CP-1]|uniref:Glycosyltransferase family 1 protein n=1 Tax=Anaeromyxobacter dehalogenans (strain ATCC BAA-258 / DSM 21875 / 2CP-1) TaxID=455488 RepID=B8JH63_ANAD2|nr:hypothetical protein [Anaeromyxobacter dehalogenans]ACL64765.1 conserved hypothetical protein [Anaeromyxobacter dehalogenans 2CP-1]
MARYAISVVSPPGYVHSAAFREVAETLHAALGALGHDAVLGTDPAPRGRRAIVLGANLLPHVRQPLAKDAILYNLEQVDSGSPWLTAPVRALLAAHEVWDYSPRNAARYAMLGLPAPRVVPIGFVPGLCRIPPAPEDVDVLFYGSMNPRRARVIEALRARGLSVETAFGLYGAARDARIARARVVLNVHFYEAKVFEIVRVSYLLANRRCVVSERGADAAEERALEEGVAFAEYGRLVEACEALARDPAARARLAEAGFRLMSARDEVAILRAALAGDAPPRGAARLVLDGAPQAPGTPGC